MTVESPTAPGAKSFRTLCEYCQQIIRVTPTDGAYRYEDHDMSPSSAYGGMRCPRADLVWEPR